MLSSRLDDLLDISQRYRKAKRRRRYAGRKEEDENREVDGGRKSWELVGNDSENSGLQLPNRRSPFNNDAVST